MSLKVIYFFMILAIGNISIEATLPAAIKDPEALIGNEIARLDVLIQATEQSLEGQKNLSIQIKEYQKLQTQYLKNLQNNDLLLKLVKNANKTLQMIKDNHLVQTFDPDFIDELTVFSQPITKRGIPKP